MFKYQFKKGERVFCWCVFANDTRTGTHSTVENPEFVIPVSFFVVWICGTFPYMTMNKMMGSSIDRGRVNEPSVF